MYKTLNTLLSFFLLFPLTALGEQNFNLNITLTAPLGTPENNGFLNQVVEGMLKPSGYKPNYEYVYEQRGLQNLNDGIDDGNLPRIAGLEKIFPNIRQVPGKVMDFDFQVFSKNKLLKINGWKSLESLDVAYVKGWKILENNVKAASVTAVPSSTHLFKLLENDRVDAVIYERWQGKEIARSMGFKDIQDIDPPLVTKEMFLYVNQKYEALVPKFSVALENMKKSGKYQTIVNKTLNK